MEEDTEVLDWGAHEGVHQAALARDAAHPQQHQQQERHSNNYTDEDEEDAVSLGEEEDDQGYFYQHQSAQRSVYDIGISSQNHEAPEGSPPPPSREDDMGANNQQTQISQPAFVEDDRPSSRHARAPSADSLARTSSSRNQHSSPQLSSNANANANTNNHNGTRLTHALPPKPVTVSSSYLPHSLSLVEAVGMATMSPPGNGRTATRDRDRERDVAKKMTNASPSKSGPGSSPATADLPQNWEKRYSRTNGDVYYYNRETFESTRTLPSSTSSASRQRGRHSRSPSSPDAPHPQASRSTRDRERAHDREMDREVEGSTRSATPDLSFKDRHYRPGEGEVSVEVQTSTVERTEVMSARIPAKSRYDRSPSLPPRRRRPRSMSPVQDTRSVQVSSARERARGSDYRSSATTLAARDAGRPAGRDRERERDRERNYTNSDSSMSKDLEPPEPGYSDRHWVASPRLPAADLSKTEQRSSRRDEVLVEKRVSTADNRERDNKNNNRPSLRHRESSRGPARDRERDREPIRQPQSQSDRRERANPNPNEQQQYIPTQRYRSPQRARTRDRDQGRDYQENEPLPLPPPAAPSSRRDRDRPLRFGPSNSSSSVARQAQAQSQPQRESAAEAARPKEREYAPDPPLHATYEEARRDWARNVIDRDHRPNDRGRDYGDRHPHRRDPALDDNKDLPRRPEAYPPAEVSRSAAGNERPPPKRYNEDRDRYEQQQHLSAPPPEEPSHRRRVPLPPQTKSFLSSSGSGPIRRDPPPHTAPEWTPTSKDPPPHRPPPDDRPPAPRRGRGEWPPHAPPPPTQGPPPPRIDTRMDVDYYPDAPRSANHPHASPYDKPRDVGGRPPPPQARESYESSGGPRANRPSATSANGLLPTGPTPRRGPEGARRDHGPSSGPSGPPSSRYDDRRGGGQDGYGPSQPDVRPGSGWRERENRGPGMHPERPSRQAYRDRQDDKVRPPPRGPPPPSTGTNNVPIGPRRGASASAPSLPPPPPAAAANLPPPAVFPHGMPPGPPPIGMPFNPDARPPPSTLIDPSKARDLPPGKESYERPPNLSISSGPPPRGPKSAIESLPRDLPPHVPDGTQQSLQATTGADRPGRRRDGRGSRFSPIETKANIEQPVQQIPDRLPAQDYSASSLPLVPSTGQDGNIDIIERPPTPPPMSREPSLSVTMDQTSSRVSEQGQSSDAHSDTSRSVMSRPSEQRQDAPQPAGPGPESTAPQMPPPSMPVQEQELSFSRPTQQQPARTFTRWGDKPAAVPTVAAATGGNLPVEMTDTSEPALSRRLSDGYRDRPPRHRKHPSDKDLRGSGPADNVYPQSLTSVRTRQQEERSGFMDRLEASVPAGENAAPTISLLARLSAQPLPDQGVPPQSLRDRLVPSKRDREDMMMDERGGPRDGPYDNDDGNENKRVKRRNGRGRGRGGIRRSMT